MVKKHWLCEGNFEKTKYSGKDEVKSILKIIATNKQKWQVNTKRMKFEY